MRYYQSQQRIKNSFSSPRRIEYSPSLLEKALGFVRVFGLSSIPEGVRSVLDYARKRGDLSQEQIKSAQLRYETEYAKNPLNPLENFFP